MTTPSQNPHGKQAPQSYAAHAVATPTHHFNSTPNSTTTPRSVPSPAIQRPGTASGFSAKHPSSSSSTNTPKNAFSSYKQPHQQQGGTAMAPSLSQMSNVSAGSPLGSGGGGGGVIGLGVTSGLMGASPANMLSFNSPAGLTGLDLGTPSALMGAAGSHSMNISLSDLGISSSSRRGNEDEERRAKLESVLAKLHGRRGGREDMRKADRFGRVSEEGVRRVGCWVGMDIESDKKEKIFEGNRQISVAGKSAVLIDISFKNNLPESVDLSFSSEQDAVIAHQAAASKVLLDDLKPPPGVAAINTKLDRFATNLETIAELDKLSVANHLNCFEAITGIYTSLQRLYEHEKSVALALFDAKAADAEASAEKEVACKKSGRPRMHARRKIGLRVEYWTGNRHVANKPTPTAAVRDEGAMDIDDSPSKPSDQQDDEEDTSAIYALHLTAEHNDPNLYPSLRVTSDWLNDRIHVPNAETTSPSALLSGDPSIDWQDPPPTYLSTSDDTQTSSADAMTLDHQHQQKLPETRFVAKLEPPLAMPWTVANDILQSVGAQAGTDIDPLQTYTSILLRKTTTSFSPQTNYLSTLGGTSAVASAEKKVLGRTKDGLEIESTQEAALWVPKQEFGYVLRSIPFAHPRQIVQILPVLRQWARVGSLLMGTFLPWLDSPSIIVPSAAKPGVRSEGKDETLSLAELLTPPEALEDNPNADVEMGGSEETESQTRKKNKKEPGTFTLDVSLATTPSPALDLVFPLANLPSGLANVSVGILDNGDVVVLSQNLIGGGSSGGDEDDGDEDDEGAGARQERVGRRLRRMGRALEVVGDLGVWVEWLRREFG